MAVAGTTKLPVLSVVGQTCDQDERVYVYLRLEAHKYSPSYCHSKVDLPDRTIHYPHAFYLHRVSVTDIMMNYGIDVDIMEGLKEKVYETYPNGVPFDGNVISKMNYFKNCDFQIKEATIYTQDTSLIVRDSFYNRLENVFRVPEGTTRTADFSFNRAGDRVKFKVYVNKNE